MSISPSFSEISLSLVVTFDHVALRGMTGIMRPWSQLVVDYFELGQRPVTGPRLHEEMPSVGGYLGHSLHRPFGHNWQTLPAAIGSEVAKRP